MECGPAKRSVLTLKIMNFTRSVFLLKHYCGTRKIFLTRIKCGTPKIPCLPNIINAERENVNDFLPEAFRVCQIL